MYMQGHRILLKRDTLVKSKSTLCILFVCDKSTKSDNSLLGCL